MPTKTTFIRAARQSGRRSATSITSGGSPEAPQLHDHQPLTQCLKNEKTAFTKSNHQLLLVSMTYERIG